MRRTKPKADLAKRGQTAPAKTNPKRPTVGRLPGDSPKRPGAKTNPIKQPAGRKPPSIRPNIGRMEGSDLDRLIAKAKNQLARIFRKECYVTAEHWDLAETLEQVRKFCTKKGDWERTLRKIGLRRQRAWEYLRYRKVFKTRPEAAACPVLEANDRIRKALKEDAGSDDPDERYTPKYAFDILLPYLPKDLLIWEGAWGTGLLAQHLQVERYQVVGDAHMDFLHQSPTKWDAIVTNVPFSKRQKFLERAYSFGKPFALLMPLEQLLGGGRHDFYKKHGIQVLVPDKRIHFLDAKGHFIHSNFDTAWFCWKLLPFDLCFAEIVR
jgi:hypothetical protein